MKKKKYTELDVAFIGRLGSLTKQEELQISEFLKAQKLKREKRQHQRINNSPLRKIKVA